MSGRPFDRIGIVGVGLIGGSVALAARRASPGARLMGLEASEGPGLEGVVDVRVRSLAELADADLIMVCVPVSEMPGTLRNLAGAATSAVVTDVCSTKRPAMVAARDAGLQSFIGGHPMAGSERAGLESARADLFEGRPWLLVRGSAGSEAELRLETFVKSLGADPHWMDAAEHDRTVAYVSHLPQILAAALMNAAEAGVPLTGPLTSGRAFAEMTRLASSPSSMWTSVLADNADFVREALAELQRQLAGASSEPSGWVGDALRRSRKARERWLDPDRTTS